MAPIHERMAVKEAAHSPGVRKVVVHSTQRSFQALELRVHSNLCAIHGVKDLCMIILQNLDRIVYLLVSLPECREVLEGGCDDPSHVTECLTMLHQLQCESEICIAENGCIGKRVDELEPAKTANGAQTSSTWQRTGCDLILWLIALCGFDQVIKLLLAIIFLKDVAQLLVRQTPQFLVSCRVKLETKFEGGNCINWSTTNAFALAHLGAVPRQKIRGRLDLVEFVGDIATLLQRLYLFRLQAPEYIPHNFIMLQRPPCDKLLDGICLLFRYFWLL
mmetsp:Transcript_62351/g.109041  ORF Transcript_62351/g.109041 Transcript_62351/m.109041 type:complete len:276 (+) Transcript_62351:532-1359(+)